MSRLRPLHVPFVQGSNDSVAAEVLPDGVFADVRNARFNKAGELVLRRGWRPLAMGVASDQGTAVTAGTVFDLYSHGASLVAAAGFLTAAPAVGSTYDPLRLQTYTTHSAATPWVLRRGAGLPPATQVRTVGGIPDLPASVDFASAAVTSDGVWGAVLAQSGSPTNTVLRVFRLATDETLFYGALSPGTGIRKIVSMGTRFGIIRNTGSALTLQAFDPSQQTGWLTTVGTLFSATVTHFDVGVATATAPTALHCVDVVAGVVSYRQFTFAGVQTGATKTVLAANGHSAHLATDDVTAHVVYQLSTTFELSLLSFAATGAYTTSAGPTALNAGVPASAFRHAIGYAPDPSGGTNTAIRVAGGVSSAGAGVARTTYTYYRTAAHVNTGTVLHSSTGLCAGWVVRGGAAGLGVVRGKVGNSQVTEAPDAFYTDSDVPWFVAHYGLGASPDRAASPYGVGLAPTGDALVLLNRTSDASVNSSIGDGTTATVQITARTFKVLDVSRRRPAAEFGGALYVSGGMLTQYVSSGLVENGMLRPVVNSLTASVGAGALTAGIYSYRAVVIWTDEGGRLHRSTVSQAVTQTVIAQNTVTAVVHVAKTLRRDSNAIANPIVELYRTEAGPGELFYLVATAVVATSNDATTVVDLLADSAILDNKRLYTEGEFGAVSGALDITPANPSAFVAVLRDRLVVASAESSYQISQTVLPEEPVAFTQPGVSGPVALVYQDAVEGTVTALATLDDTIVAATATGLSVSAADGPGPNLAGVGEFSSPARLPSEVGVFRAESLVEDSAGLWFLGAVDKLYVLPRGQPTPVFAGEAVQDRLASGTVVGAGRSVADDVTAWAVAAGAASLVLAHDTVLNVWLADGLPFVPVALVSHQGKLYAADSAGAVWEHHATAYGDAAAGATAVALRVTTGDVAVFGLSGHGRLATVEVEGVFEAAAALLAEVSYDQGLSWTALGTHTVTGLAVGEVFQRQFYPARQRGGKFRLRLTMTPSVTTTEGCRLTGFTLWHTTRSGPTRLASAKRL